MDKEKAKVLSEILARYKELQENDSVNLIEFHTADGQRHGIGNPEAIKLLLSVAVIEDTGTDILPNCKSRNSRHGGA